MNHNIMFGKIKNIPTAATFAVVENDTLHTVQFTGKPADLAAKYLSIGKTISVQGNEFLIITAPKTGKEKWMVDFLSTKEVVTDKEEIKEFLRFYSPDIKRDVLPETVYCFEGSYFFIKQDGKYIIDYDGEHHEFQTLEMAELCIADIELDDNSVEEIYLHMEPKFTLISSAQTELTATNLYNDVIILKDGTTIRIGDGVITVCKDNSEEEQIGQIFYQS